MRPPKTRPKVSSVGLSLSVQVPDHVPDGDSFRITNSTVEMAEVTDLAEKMVRQGQMW